MKRFLVFGIVVGCVAGTLGAAAGQQPVFRGDSDAVRLFVTVTDGDGRLVTTLTRDQFEVRDEGKAQPITLFDNTPQPIQLIVMLDVSGSMEGNLPLLRAGTEQLYARLRRDDRIRIGTFGRDVAIGPWMTRNGDQALRHELPETIAPDALTPLWRAIDQAMDAFGEGDDTRRVILVLSDGKDSGPLFRQRVVSQVEVIDRARRDDVMIYGVGMRSRGARPMPGIGPGGLQAALTADLPDPGLARVAEEAGGGYLEIRFGQDLGAAFARVADELHSQYLIGFDPPKRDGKVHEIDIRLSPKGLKARGRKSYTAPK
jgi:Ca-activated chloride channel family protein